MRKRLLSENRTTQYLIYALGEIILVVIGILIALQVNNWNSDRLDRRDIEQRFNRIHEELVQTSTMLKRSAGYIDSVLITNNSRTLRLLSARHKDSLTALSETLFALPNVTTISFNVPVSEEFINEGYITKIENPDIKSKLFALKNAISFSTILEEYATAQLQNIIEPFLMKHLNYAQITRNPNLIAVNPVEDYAELQENVEFENIVNLKLEVDRNKSAYLKRLVRLLEALDTDIMDELNSE